LHVLLHALQVDMVVHFILVARHVQAGLGGVLEQVFVLHVLVGAVDLENSVSMELHKRLGFEHCGTIKQAAFKFGRWLDLAFLQKTLVTPLQPVDG